MMKKRLIVALLAAATIIAAMPIASSATDTRSIQLYFDGATPVDVMVQTTGSFKDGGTWSYSDNVLTITDAKATYDDNCGIITVGNFDDLTINVVGNCVFTCKNECSAINAYQTNNITITGSGTLTVNGDQFGIGGFYDLTFDNANVVVKTNGADYGGLTTGHYMIFKGKPNISVETGGYAVKAGEEIIFNMTGGSVTATGAKLAFVAAAVNTIKFENGKNMYSIVTNKGANGDAKFCEMPEYMMDAWTIVNADGTPATYAQIKYIGGADTSDSSDIALFGMLAVIALAGAGFAAKKKFN